MGGCTTSKAARGKPGEQNSDNEPHAVILKYTDFLKSNNMLLNSPELLSKTMDFKATIQKLSINKLFKKMRFSLKVQLEESVDESFHESSNGERQRRFRPLESEANKDTAIVTDPCHAFQFSDTIQFQHRTSLQDLRNQYLKVSLLDHSGTTSQGATAAAAEVISVYRIDLLLLALGPVHHNVQLNRNTSGCFSTGTGFAANLSVDIKFVQIQKIEIQLASLEVETNASKVMNDAYYTGFNVVTHRDVQESNKSYHEEPRQIKGETAPFGKDIQLPTDLNTTKNNLAWYFEEKKLSSSEGEKEQVAHHLDSERGIFENSLDKDVQALNIAQQNTGQSEAAEKSKVNKEPPYCMFTLHMENLTDASVQLKIWEDKHYKDKKRISLGQKIFDNIQLRHKSNSVSGSVPPKGEKRGNFFMNAIDEVTDLRMQLKKPAKQEMYQFVNPQSIQKLHRDDSIESINDDEVLDNVQPLPQVKPVNANDINIQVEGEKVVQSSKKSHPNLKVQVEVPGGEYKPKLVSQEAPLKKTSSLLDDGGEIDYLDQPKLRHHKSEYAEAGARSNYQVQRGVLPTGDATDVYGHTMQSQSPFLQKKRSLLHGQSSEQIEMRSSGSNEQDVLNFTHEHLLGECHISFEKLLNGFFQFQEKKNLHMSNSKSARTAPAMTDKTQLQEKTPIQRQKTVMLQNKVSEFQQLAKFDENLWLCGSKIGTVKGSLRFINFPFIEQMPIGVLNNKGIQFSSKPLLKSDKMAAIKTATGTNLDFKAILENKTKLIRYDKHEIQLTFGEAINTAEDLYQLLLISEKQSMVSFIYQNENDLMRAQAVFIEIGEHMLEFCDYVNQFAKVKYYSILVAVLERSELDLGQMMFENPQEYSKKHMAQKKEITAAFQKFIHKVLEHGINLMHLKGIDKFKREFVCKSITLGYIRVPKFRDIFLDQITEAPRGNLRRSDGASAEDEHREFDPALNLNIDEMIDNHVLPQGSIMKDNSAMHKFIDWQQYCYDFIDKAEEESNFKIIESVLNVKKGEKKQWTDRIQRRGQVFFMICQSIVRHLRKVLYNEKSIVWKHIPGYRKLLKALLEELQTRNIHYFPDSLVEVIKSFLSNPKLLTVVIKIIFSKTNKFDSLGVLKTIDMTQIFFLKLNRKQIIIPSDFDWTFFMKGVLMLLSLDHSTSTAKALWLLYQIFHTIPKVQRDALVRHIITNPLVFYHFFFHWSWHVRTSFYYFFYFQLHRLFIDSQGAANDMHQSIKQSLADLGLQEKDHDDTEKKEEKLKIPLHEKLPKEDYVDKEAPEPFAEIKFFQIAKDPMRMSSSFAGTIAEGTRLDGTRDENLYRLFKDRVDEVQTLRLLCKTIEAYISRNKERLLKKESKVAIHVISMQKSMTDLRRESMRNIDFKDYASATEVEASPLSEAGQQLHDKLEKLQKVHSFNLNNFAEATDEILHEIDNLSSSPFEEAKKQVSADASQAGVDGEHQRQSKQPKYILTDSQRKRWKELIQKVPEANRIYIQQSFLQLQAAQRDYQDWQKYGQRFEDFIESEKAEVKGTSVQGFDGKPDFPKVDIIVTQDAREMETSNDW